MRKHGSPALWYALVAGITLTAAGESIRLPEPEGPHPVGYWPEVLVTDDADDLSPEPGERRRLLLEVFYPAARQGPPKPYATEFIAAYLTDRFPFPDGFTDDVVTHAGAGVEAKEGRFPVVVFSHGLSWPVTLYQSLTEDLASRGFVVVAVNHPHVAPIDYDAGDTLGNDAWPEVQDEQERDAMLARRVSAITEDLRDTLAEIASWASPAEGNPVAGRLDLARIGAAGHSYGGTAAGALTGDPRLKAVVAMEGRARNPDGSPVTVQVPFLHLIGGYNRLEFENRGYRPSAGAPVYQAIIDGTGHAYFSDLIYLYRHYGDEDWQRRHRYEIDPARTIQITRDYLAAFFGRYLEGREAGVLLRPVGYQDRFAGPVTGGYPEVDLTIAVE